MRYLLPFLLVSCSEYQVTKDAESDPGPGPDIEVSPVFIDFGVQPQDGAPVSAVITIENIGGGALDVTSAVLSEPSGPYSVTAMDGATLLSEEALDLIVEYTPSADGTHREQLIVSSNDTDEPYVPVEIQGITAAPDDPIETGSPDLLATPLSYDFGVIPTGDLASTAFDLSNAGDAVLTIDDILFITGTSEVSLNIHPGINGTPPWLLEPGETRSVTASYTPTDDVLDVAQIVVLSDDPDTPEETLTTTGNGRTFEGFSTGWYIYDDGIDHETTSSPEHPVTTHGDSDLYWYEPSGAHGLIDSMDPEADFALMRDHVILGAGAPTVVSGPMTFSSSSHLSTFAFATYTYVMCDFWIEPTEDPGRYTVSADTVDDGIQVMVNGEILGRMNLGAAPTDWSLSETGRPGEVNTLIVILVDDSASLRYLTNLAFYKDGVMVE